MALIVILICLGVQRYLKFNSYSHQLNWIEPYFKWMSGKFEQITKGHGFIGAAILVLPILIVIAIIFALVYNWLGVAGYAILNIALVWYCLDGRDMRKDPYENMNPEAVFTATYRDLFGIMFWYAVFGPVGLALYFTVSKLLNLTVGQQPTSPEEEKASLQTCLNKIMGVLDWVPVRLVGLSYALVGHFGSVFKSWFKHLLNGVSDTYKLVAVWGMIALQHAGVSVPKPEASSTEVVSDPQAAEAITLTDRSLLVWLIVIFLVTFGTLIS